MLDKLANERKLGLLVAAVLLVKLLSVKEEWVEQYYTYGIYPRISGMLRLLFGWLPFSIGDVLYFLAALFLLWKGTTFLIAGAKSRFRHWITWSRLRKLLFYGLIVYLLFNVLWGFNYNRQGIAAQMKLEVKEYSVAELFQLANMLQQRVNFYGAQIDSVKRSHSNVPASLFRQGVKDYATAAKTFPYLRYQIPSIKPSLYGDAGKYFGYTGYYNPFTGEGQIKPSIPIFIKPFVINHEIAHGLGYAKENEANFVSYLVCKGSENADVRYSAYFEMFEYAYWQCMLTQNREHTIALKRGLSKRVRADQRTLFLYRRGMKNAIEPFMSDFYDGYLKLNNQPKGKATYSEVVAWMIAYMKKYGPEAI